LSLLHLPAGVAHFFLLWITSLFPSGSRN
jgi:hypothetical protein